MSCATLKTPKMSQEKILTSLSMQLQINLAEKLQFEKGLMPWVGDSCDTLAVDLPSTQLTY